MALGVSCEAERVGEDIVAFHAVSTRALLPAADAALFGLAASFVAFQLGSYGAQAAWHASVLAAAACAAARAAWLLSAVRQETVVVFDGLGVELRSLQFSGRSSTRFLDRAAVEDVFVHEGVTACRVIFYLALAVRGERELVLPFRRLFPRLPFLRQVALGVRRVLTD